MRAVLLAAVLAASGAAACSADGSASTLDVLAAASLTEAFSALEAPFEAAHDGVDVVLHFGGSSSLAHQIGEGAPADVFAAADEETMASVVDRGDARDPLVFAVNRLELVVEDGNPLGLRGLADLARPGLVFVACAPQVPCGRLAEAALTQAGIRARPASLEENVKAVVGRVALGEADAGLAYRSDARAGRRSIEGVAIEPATSTRYSIAVTRGADDRALAAAWVDFVTSPVGRRALERAGFEGP